MYPSKKVLGVPAAVLGHVPGVIYGLYQVIEDGQRRTLQEEATPAVAKIVRRGHSGEVENRTPLQRLVDTMLDRAEASDPSVEYVIWMPSLESLLLPRDPTDGPRSTSPLTHRYRTHRVQPFDTPTLTVWVSPPPESRPRQAHPPTPQTLSPNTSPAAKPPMIGDDVPAR